jgi:hypothetical protein
VGAIAVKITMAGGDNGARHGLAAVAAHGLVAAIDGHLQIQTGGYRQSAVETGGCRSAIGPPCNSFGHGVSGCHNGCPGV